jgi:hypothetical protein
MHVSQAYALLKMLEHSFGIHTGHNTAGDIRSLVANHVTEFKNFNFCTYQKIVKLKGSQLEIEEVETKFK